MVEQEAGKATNLTAFFTDQNQALYIHAVFTVCLFAVTIQFLLLRVKIYESNSQMSLRAAGGWIRNTNIVLSVGVY